MPRALILTLVTLSLLSGASAWAQQPPKKQAEAAHRADAPSPLEALDLSRAYSEEPLVISARGEGLTSEVLRALEEPETPNDRRVAIVAALIRGGRVKQPSRLWLRRLASHHRVPLKQLDVAKLATHEALVLGWMLAMEQPRKLSGAGEQGEAGRAEPVLLLTAAANRHRGDLTINLINALIKAQLAIVQPDREQCAPGACLDAVLARYTDVWSMRPEAVCDIVDAVSAASAPKPELATQRCEAVRARAQRAPHYVEDAEAGAAALVAPPLGASAQAPAPPSRFSQTPAPLPNMLGGLGLPPAVEKQLLAQLNLMMRSGQMPSPAEMMRLQNQLIQELMRQHGALAPGAQGRMPGGMSGGMFGAGGVFALPSPSGAPPTQRVGPRAQPVQQPTTRGSQEILIDEDGASAVDADAPTSRDDAEVIELDLDDAPAPIELHP